MCLYLCLCVHLLGTRQARVHVMLRCCLPLYLYITRIEKPIVLAIQWALVRTYWIDEVLD